MTKEEALEKAKEFVQDLSRGDSRTIGLDVSGGLVFKIARWLYEYPQDGDLSGR